MEITTESDIKELKSQLAVERQNSYRFEQQVKAAKRDHALELDQINLLLKTEKEKNSQLETIISEFKNLDSIKLQMNNSILQAKLATLETDYSSLKSKLFQDFPLQDFTFNRAPEENLKISQSVDYKNNYSKFDELVQELISKNQDLQEELIKQGEKFEEENQNIREELNNTQVLLDQKKRDYLRSLEKLEYEMKENERLRNELNELEEKLKGMEKENDKLMVDINNREKKIKSLSQDLNTIHEEQQDSKDLEIDRLLRALKKSNKETKVLKDEKTKILREKEEISQKLADLKFELNRKTENFEKEKKIINENVLELKEKISDIEKAAQEKEENLRLLKDQTVFDLQQKISILKKEKSELEKNLGDFQDHFLSKSQTGGSLNDELSQLIENLSKKPDKKNEFSELTQKDLQIQVLKTENLSLQSQFDELVPNLLMIHPDHQFLLSENKRLESEISELRKIWVKEIDSLSQELRQAETLLLNSNMSYAEAATDRDHYQKLYVDVLKSLKGAKVT